MVDGFRQGGFSQGLTQGLGAGSALFGRLSQNELSRQQVAGQARQGQADTQAKQIEEERKFLQSDIDTIRNIVDEANKNGSEAGSRALNGIAATIPTLAKRAQSLGIQLDEEMLFRDLEARVAGAENPQDVQNRALREAQTEVDTSRLQLRQLENLPEDQQEAIRQQLGFGSTDESFEFLRLLDEAEQLGQSGQTESTRFSFVTDRLERLSEKGAQGQGLAITFTDDGRVAGVSVGPGAQVQPGLASKLSGGQLFEQDQRIADIDRSVADLDGLIKQTVLDPEDFGATGSVRRTGQTIADGLSDVASAFGNLTGGAVDLNTVADAFASAFGVEDAFDEDLPAQEVLERNLAISLAKLRISRGGTGTRALADIFKAAKKDTQLTGFTSSRAVKNKLEQIRREFTAERDAITRGLSGQSPQSVQVDDLGSLSDEELDRLLQDLE